jgi:hypothetical protein
VTLNLQNRFDGGGYSDIFGIDERVYKLYISAANRRCNHDRPSHLENELRRINFQSELKVWEIASTRQDLRELTPVFYGRVQITNVIDQHGKDISNLYLPDCCYSMEWIRGNAQKFDLLSGKYPDVIPHFQNAGILHTIDMSVIIIKNKIKLIDFAVRDAYFETEREWLQEGIL